jgi:anti-sigma B factor antagonist
MRIDRIEVGPVTVLRLFGDIDESAVDGLRGTLFECISENRSNIVLNLAEVKFISYMGVGILVERLRKVRACGGDIKLCYVNLYSERLFRMVGVSSLFETYDAESQAVGVFQEAAA